MALPAPPPPGWAGASGPAGVASAPPGGGTGGLGRARLRGGDCGGKVNSAHGRLRPQPAPEEGEPGGRLSAFEARHGGEAHEPGGTRVYGEGGGARAALTTLDRLGPGGSETTFPRGHRVPRDGRGSAPGSVRRRKSFPWLYKRGLERSSSFCVFGAFVVSCPWFVLRPMLCGPGNPGLLL